MKLTKSQLKEMVRKELKEFTTTGGGTKAVTRRKAATAKTKTAKATHSTKLAAYKTKTADRKSKATAKTAADSAYTTKVAAEPAHKFSYRGGDNPRGPLVTIGVDPSGKYPRTAGYNPAWSTWEAERASALSDRTSKRSAYDTAVSDEASAETRYKTALKNMSDAEKAEMATKAATGFGFGAGAGGRAGGKGGTAKGKGKGKGKKDESLHRILGEKYK